MSGGDPEVKETPEEKELAGIAMEEWNAFQEDFVPLENQFISAVQMSPDDVEYVRGEAVGTAGTEIDRGGEKVEERALAQGMQPGSGRFKATLGDIAAARANAAGRADVNASLTADRLHQQGLSTALAVGRGQQSQAQLGLRQAASEAGQDAIIGAQNDQLRSESTAQAIGTAVGMGAREYGFGKDENMPDEYYTPGTDWTEA